MNDKPTINTLMSEKLRFFLSDTFRHQDVNFRFLIHILSITNYSFKQYFHRYNNIACITKLLFSQNYIFFKFSERIFSR